MTTKNFDLEIIRETEEDMNDFLPPTPINDGDNDILFVPRSSVGPGENKLRKSISDILK